MEKQNYWQSINKHTFSFDCWISNFCNYLNLFIHHNLKLFLSCSLTKIFLFRFLIFQINSKNLLHKLKILVIIKNLILLKNIFKLALQYLFNVFILFNTGSYLKLNFKLKIEPKICTFKNVEEIWKT